MHMSLTSSKFAKYVFYIELFYLQTSLISVFFTDFSGVTENPNIIGDDEVIPIETCVDKMIQKGIIIS